MKRTAAPAYDQLANGPDASAGRWRLVASALERLAHADSHEAVIAVLREAVRPAFGADGVCYVLREGNRVRYVAEDAIAPLWEGQTFRTDACISGLAMREGRTLIIPDIYADPRVPHDAYRLTFVESMIMAPVGDPARASIGIYWAQKNAAGAEEAEMLGLIARTADAALSTIERIAAQRRVEAALIAQSERFRIAEHAGGVGAFEWYPETGEMIVSDEYRRLWGFAPDDVVTADRLVAALHPDDVPASGPAKLGERVNPLEYAEYRIRRIDTGEERWLARRGRIMVPPEGGAPRFVGVAFDITDRKRIEAQLSESEQRFRLIADSAPVPMWVTVKGGGPRAFVNHAYCAFVGRDYDAACRFDWREALHPEDVDRIVAESIAGEASGKRFSLEARYRRADGEWRWLHSESQPRWGPQGEWDGFIGIAYDITLAKQAEEELRRLNDRLEERVTAALADKARAEASLRQVQKMEAVGQLTGGISHDFNNLLTPVIGGLEVIAAKTGDERLQRLAENALAAARRGAKLTGQLLAFSRIQRLSIVPTDINAVISGLLELVQGTIGRLVTVRAELDPGAGFAMGDANQIENAILNLAINARDAMPGGGTLTIATKRIRLDAGVDFDAGDYVAIAVGDNGSGMSPEVLARATEPFFTTKPVGQGTGLGLAQVYGMARQSGGSVEIESEPGQGTKVTILLPVAGAAARYEAEESESAAAGEPKARPKHVLVVDDDADVRAFLTDALESLGHRVMFADCGDAGLVLLERERPDLVLLDYAMPGMSGADFAAQARAFAPGLPIMIVSGYADSEALLAALGSDMRVLKKPFGVVELAAAVESAA